MVSASTHEERRHPHPRPCDFSSGSCLPLANLLCLKGTGSGEPQQPEPGSGSGGRKAVLLQASDPRPRTQEEIPAAGCGRRACPPPLSASRCPVLPCPAPCPLDDLVSWCPETRQTRPGPAPEGPRRPDPHEGCTGGGPAPLEGHGCGGPPQQDLLGYVGRPHAEKPDGPCPEEPDGPSPSVSPTSSQPLTRAPSPPPPPPETNRRGGQGEQELWAAAGGGSREGGSGEGGAQEAAARA